MAGPDPAIQFLFAGNPGSLDGRVKPGYDKKYAAYI